MMVHLLKTKLHMGRVTQADLEYEGSLTIDEDLMDLAGIQAFERVLVANVNNGERFETYAIAGPRGSRMLCLNGATARKGLPGDRIIVFVFSLYDAEEARTHRPRVLLLDEENRVHTSA